MIGPLVRLAGRDERILVGPETADDAGVYLLDGLALVATADFITPVCDDPRRFGRVAAANSLSDVYAMGGRPLFALNLCCFPPLEEPDAQALQGILEGAAGALADARAVLLGGHSVRDPELKFGLAVVGQADPDRLLTNAKARPGDRLVLTKPLGTGVLINAFKVDRIDESGLEPALREMERLNAEASRLALLHGVHAATDITGFGLAGHASEMAAGSHVTIEIDAKALPIIPGALEIASKNRSGGMKTNEEHFLPGMEFLTGSGDGMANDARRDILFDPQTSGGLLISVAADAADELMANLKNAGIQPVLVGSVGPASNKRLKIR